MKKSLLMGAVPTLALAATTGTVKGHNVTVVNPNAENLTDALGITTDRAKELMNDIITACKTAISAGKNALTLMQIIAIASQHAQNDNELVMCTAVVSEAYAREDLQGLADETTQANGEDATNTTTASADQDEEGNDDEQDFAQFLQMMMAQAAGEAITSEKGKY